MHTRSPTDAPIGARRDRVPQRQRLVNRASLARRSAGRTAWLVIVAAVVGYLVIVPLARLQALALEDRAMGYQRFRDLPRLGEVIRTTLLLAFGSLVIAAVLGTGLAWMSTRLPRRCQWMAVIPMLPIVVPAVASVTGWSFLLSPRPGYINQLLRATPFFGGRDGPIDIYSAPGITAICGIQLTAMVYVFARAGLRNVGSDLIEAARISGSSPTITFVRVTIPLVRPSLVYGVMVALLLSLGQITAPLLLGRANGIDVLATEMYNSAATADYATAAAIGSPLLLVGLVVVLMQRVLLGETSRFVTHAGKGFQSRAETSRWAAAGIASFGVVALLLPLAALVSVALGRFWSGKFIPADPTLDNFRVLWRSPEVMDSIRTSILTSVGAVAIALPAGFVLATIALRERKRRVLRTTIDFLATLPLGLPAVLFGAGFLFTYTRAPLVLYGTRWVIVIVYVTLMLPFTTRLQMAGMVALGERYEEAARTSGAGPVRAKLQILVPLMRSTFGAAAALMLILLTHEFAASLLVRSVHTQVMGTQLADMWANGTYPVVAAFALVMCLVTTIGVMLATVLGGRRAFDRL